LKANNNHAWRLIFACLVFIALYNMYRSRNLSALNEAQHAQLLSSVSLVEHKELMALSLKFNGHILKWPELERLGEGPVAEGERLVLAFSEDSCNSCRESETRFMLEMAERIGAEHVVILIHADSVRYVNAYMVTNQINIPVFYDKEGSFLKQNHIEKTPMTLLLNERNEVMAGHFPSPGKPELSEPFRVAMNQFFGVQD